MDNRITPVRALKEHARGQRERKLIEACLFLPAPAGLSGLLIPFLRAQTSSLRLAHKTARSRHATPRLPTSGTESPDARRGAKRDITAAPASAARHGAETAAHEERKKRYATEIERGILQAWLARAAREVSRLTPGASVARSNTQWEHQHRRTRISAHGDDVTAHPASVYSPARSTVAPPPVHSGAYVSAFRTI